MARKPRPSSKPAEQKRNGYEDDDMRQLLTEIEDLEQEKVTIRMEAAGKSSGVSKKIKAAKGRARSLGIPLAILDGLLKTRRLERQIKAAAETIPDDLAELWEEASGQFSFLAPAGEEPLEPGDTAAQAAARQHAEEAKQRQEAELEEGDAVLKDLTGAMH